MAKSFGCWPKHCRFESCLERQCIDGLYEWSFWANNEGGDDTTRSRKRREDQRMISSSGTMYVSISFRKSTPPQNRQLNVVGGYTRRSRKRREDRRVMSCWALSWSYLTEAFTKSFCRSKFLHKSVNLSFIITDIKDKLTDLSENWLLSRGREAERRSALIPQKSVYSVILQKSTPA